MKGQIGNIQFTYFINVHIYNYFSCYRKVHKTCLAYKLKNKLQVFINYTNLITEREKIKMERVEMH